MVWRLESLIWAGDHHNKQSRPNKGKGRKAYLETEPQYCVGQFNWHFAISIVGVWYCVIVGKPGQGKLKDVSCLAQVLLSKQVNQSIKVLVCFCIVDCWLFHCCESLVSLPLHVKCTVYCSTIPYVWDTVFNTFKSSMYQLKSLVEISMV